MTWWRRNKPVFGGALCGVPFCFILGGPDLTQAAVLAVVGPLGGLCILLGVDFMVYRRD